MTVRLAEKKDSEHVFKIWRACFTEDKAYIDNYLKFCLPYTKTWLLALDNNEVVSCLSVLPSFVKYNNEILKGGYLYAVGTLPEHRGNSFSKELMITAIQSCRDLGFAYLIVKPADEKLFAFYIKSSFDRVISKGLSSFSTIISNEKDNLYTGPIETIILTSHELYNLRNSAFSNTNFLWQEEILNYAILEARGREGSCKIIKHSSFYGTPPIYYIAYPDDLCTNKIKVLETNAKTQIEFAILISSLKQEYRKMEEAEINFPLNYIDYSALSLERSALLLSFSPRKYPNLEKFHLSLPLE